MKRAVFLDRSLSGSINGHIQYEIIMRENLELKNRLDNPIPENIKELQNYEKKQWQERLHRFVETEASKAILESMKKDQCILVTGPQGSGKSSLAFHVALTLEETEECELLIVTNPDDIVKYASKDKKQIFVIDDIFGKYSVHDYDTMWWSKQGNLVLKLLDRNKDFKILATCRSYMYNSVDIVTVKSAFVHLNLLGEDLQLTEDNRRKIGKSYLNAEIIDQLGNEVIMKFRFFPTLCAKYSPDTKENAVEYFSTPYSYVAEEIEQCNKTKDLHYFSLALMVISNNNVKKEKLIQDNNNQNQDRHFNELIHGLANEIGYTQVPSKQLILFCLNALVGSYCMETEDGFSFINETLVYIIAHVMSQRILRSLLKYSKTSFLKDRVQFLSLKGHPPKLTIMIPLVLEKAYFDRILIDIKQGIFWDVITDTQNAFPQFREAFISYIKTMLKRNDLKNSDDGSTVVHAVSLEGYDDYLTYFLHFDKSLVNKENRSGQIPLHLACLKGHSHTAELLLKKGAFIDKTDKNENTPLDLACAGGHTDTVAVLLSKSATIKQRIKDLKTALHVVCSNGNIRIAEKLLHGNAKVNITDTFGHTPLHLASMKGCVEIVELLIKNNADINLADNKGRTAIYLACEHKYCRIAELLLNSSADTCKESLDGKRPIHSSCSGGCLEIVQLLLSNNVDINQRDRTESTPLHWACKGGHDLIVKVLLEKNADVNLNNRSRETPLHIACNNGNANMIIRMLLEHNAIVNCKNLYKKTPLHLACERGLQGVVSLLLKNNANANAIDKESCTPLHLACFGGHEKVVEELCAHNVSIDKTNKYGMTPLHICCEQGYSHLIEILLQNGADINKIENEGLTPLYIACRDKKIDIIKLLLLFASKVNETDKDGLTPLYLACKESNTEMAQMLIAEGAIVNQADKHGITPLHLTAQAGNTNLTKLLLESKASVNMAEKLGQTPLFKSVSSVHKDVTELLLKNGASVNACDNFGMTPTGIALQKRDREAINLLEHYKA
ncbi:ankyrin-1-like [Mytilus trossulus]|uniref:ankyrin-1-like n=1 Tax=Mytilus trossulus TaxID=6551 RepID=UPI003007EE90